MRSCALACVGRRHTGPRTLLQGSTMVPLKITHFGANYLFDTIKRKERKKGKSTQAVSSCTHIKLRKGKLLGHVAIAGPSTGSKIKLMKIAGVDACPNFKGAL